jgi:hypothetical protein
MCKKKLNIKYLDEGTKNLTKQRLIFYIVSQKTKISWLKITALRRHTRRPQSLGKHRSFPQESGAASCVPFQTTSAAVAPSALSPPGRSSSSSPTDGTDHAGRCRPSRCGALPGLSQRYRRQLPAVRLLPNLFLKFRRLGGDYCVAGVCLFVLRLGDASILMVSPNETGAE